MLLLLSTFNWTNWFNHHSLCVCVCVWVSIQKNPDTFGKISYKKFLGVNFGCYEFFAPKKRLLKSYWEKKVYFFSSFLSFFEFELSYGFVTFKWILFSFFFSENWFHSEYDDYSLPRSIFFSFVRLFIITASGMHNDDDPYITILYGFLCWKNFSLMVMIIIHTHTRKEMLTMIIIIMSCEWWWILSHHDHQQNHYGQQ